MVIALKLHCGICGEDIVTTPEVIDISVSGDGSRGVFLFQCTICASRNCNEFWESLAAARYLVSQLEELGVFGQFIASGSPNTGGKSSDVVAIFATIFQRLGAQVVPWKDYITLDEISAFAEEASDSTRLQAAIESL